MTEEDQEALGRVALAHDFDPVPWEEAPEWRKTVARKVAVAACHTDAKLGGADHVRSAWTLTMTEMGWKWGRVVDESTREHPGIIYGELSQSGVRHWNSVIRAVRDEARRRSVRLTGE